MNTDEVTLFLQCFVTIRWTLLEKADSEKRLLAIIIMINICQYTSVIVGIHILFRNYILSSTYCFTFSIF